MLRGHAILAIWKRNVASYFSGVLGYLFIIVFVVAATAMAFTPEFFANNAATLDQLNEVFPLLLLFIIPAITMGVWADERKQGTDELLFTLPARDVEILLAKYLAVLTVYTIALAFSVFQLFVMETFSDPDWSLLLTTYLGYWLAGAALASAGMLASALARSATVAFVLGALFCAIPVFIAEIPGVREYLPILRDLSLSEQFRDFAQGIIPLNGLVYFATLTAFLLYLNLVVITRRHWSGREQARMGLQYLIRTLGLLVILASFNLMARASTDVLDLRADMTADELYTLSDTTERTLESLDDERKITIEAFLSPEVPRDYVNLRKRLIGLLHQYDRIGGRATEFRLIDTPPFSEAASEAETYGIRKQRVVTERSGRQETAEFYLGVRVSSSFDEVVVPFIDQETPLEYELTRSVATVSDRHRRTVGILRTDARLLGGRDMNTFQAIPEWGIVDELKKQYDVVGIDPNSPYDEQASLELFKTEAKGVDRLDAGELPAAVRDEYAKKNVELGSGDDLEIETVTAGSKWRLADEEHGYQSVLVLEDDKLVAYRHLDVLLAPLPSSLDQAGMDRLVDELEKGLPALIFDDPLPVLVGMQHAPMNPKQPPGNPMMGMNRPAVPRADDGLATSLMDLLGLSWSARRTFEIPANYATELDDGRVPETLPAVYAAHDLHLDPDAKVTIVELGKEWKIEDTSHGHTTTLEKSGSRIEVAGEPELVGLWEGDNPHPKISDLLEQVGAVFISRQIAGSSAFAENSPVTRGLDEVLALFPGRVRESKGSELRHEPLLVTGKNSGTMLWSDMTQVPRSMFGGSTRSIKQDRPHYRDDFNHVLAMRVRSSATGTADDDSQGGSPRSPNKLDVIYVADLDFITDVLLFILEPSAKQQFDYELDLDNLEFVLNSIDALAGDEDVIALRNRERRTRPLIGIQTRINEFREERQVAEEAARKKAEKERSELQQRMVAASRKVNQNTGEGLAGRLQEFVTIAQAEQRRSQLRMEEIEREQQRIVDRLKGKERSQIEALETRIRLWAVLLPVLPPLLIGMIVLGVRSTRERNTISPTRSR